MGMITGGLGRGSGNLITQGLGGLLEKAREIVTKVSELYIPMWEKARPFTEEIPVLGDLVREFEELFPVKGRVLPPEEILRILLEDSDEEYTSEKIKRLEDSIKKREELLDKKERELVEQAYELSEYTKLMKELKEADELKAYERRKAILEKLYKIVKKWKGNN